MADAFLALISPVGLVVLTITGSGIFLAVLVALGGWGNRDLGKKAKILFGILSALLILLGAIGIVAVIFPTFKEFYRYVSEDAFLWQLPLSILLWMLVIATFIAIINFSWRKYKVFRSKPPTVNQSTKSISSKIEWSPVIVPNENWYGQKLETYAGIRIDGEGNCSAMKAKLKSIARRKVNGELELLELNIINPTNEFLRWDEKNKCILKVLGDWSNKPRILFGNMRYYEISAGTYELCIEFLKQDIHSIEIKKTLEIRKPASTIYLKWK